MDHETFNAFDKAEQELQLLTSAEEVPTVEPVRDYTNDEAKRDQFIALVGSRTFARECMHRSFQAALSLPVVSFSAVSELEHKYNDSVALVLLSLTDAGQAECMNAFTVLSALTPRSPIVVLAPANDIELARTAIRLGAKGYIPCQTDFEIAIEALKFILAGGTYIPAEYLLAADAPRRSATEAPAGDTLLTKREASIVKAIQEGKSNKVIAYQLGMCEGTVKVHLRNIMKKMKAKNRTEVAIRAQAAVASAQGLASFALCARAGTA